MPGQVILMSGQVILMSGHVILMSGQVILMSRQVILMPGQVILMSRQVILLSAGHPVICRSSCYLQVILSEAKDLPVRSGFLAPLRMAVVGRFLCNLTSQTRSRVLGITVDRWE